jgi:lysozyme family protein
MKENYKAFIDRVISKYEGGYGWNKSDPGGPTKYGITCFDLAAHRGKRMDSMARWAPIVRAMPLSEAEDIYATKYATSVRFNDLQSGADCVMMDYAINSGASRPIRLARHLLGLVTKKTIDTALVNAINKTEAKHFIDAICAGRLVFMRGLRIWRKFGSGWTKRVNDLRAYSEHLAVGTPKPTPKIIDPLQMARAKETK